MIANTYVVKPFGISEVKVIALKGDPGSPTQEQVNAAVEEYMDDHPEAQIPDGAVSTAKIADDAVTTDKIDDDAVTTDKVEDEAITTEKMASNTVAPYADNLVSSSYVSDSEPYLFRKTFAGVREDDEIVGGSVVWNQLLDKGVYPATQTINGVTFTNNGDGTITVNGTATAEVEYALMSSFPLPYGHKVLMMGCPSGGSASTYALLDNYQRPVVRDVGNGIVYNINTTSNRATARIRILSGVTVNNLVFKPQIFDLTLMFGSTIADYIYSLETATAGAGVALFRSLFSKPYYAYNAGEIISVNTSAHKMTGFNQWDKANIEDGYISDVTGAVGGTSASKHTGYIRVVGNTKYYVRSDATTGRWGAWYDSNKNYIGPLVWVQSYGFIVTAPQNAEYARLTVNYNNGSGNPDTFCFNFSDPSRNGQYEPYDGHVYPLDSSLTLRGIPKLDANNNLYYDGDIYKADGTVNRKYGVVDLGTLAWTKVKASATNIVYFQSTALSGVIKKPTLVGDVANILSTHFFPVAWSSATTDTGAMAVSPSGQISCQWHPFDEYTTEQFKTAMSGVYLVYELATPTTETAEPFTNPQVCYPDGTEEYIDTRDVPIPVGHNTKYMRDLKKLLEGIPHAPTANGTYVLKATVSSSGVTYAWIAG